MTADGDASREAADGPGPRRASRLAAVQALYQIELAESEVEGTILEFLRHRRGATLESDATLEMDDDFFADLVRGACRHQGDIDERIAGALSPSWRMARLESVLRAILRCAVYELLMRLDVPVRATINEYVEATHAYFSGEEPKFANAVLDRIARALRPGEFDAEPRPGPRPPPRTHGR